MATEHVCTYCQITRPGRFTRRKDAPAGGWSQGIQQVTWCCFSCVPQGQGVDEVAPRATTAKTTPTNPITVAKVKEEGIALLQPLKAHLPTVITTVHQYENADSLLGRVKMAQKRWDERMEPIIRPIRNGLDELYKLKAEVAKPLLELEGDIKGLMRAYKLEEARIIREETQAREAEQRRLQAEADELARKEEAAKTAQMRNRIAAKREELDVKAAEVAAQPVTERVYGASSSARARKVWRIEDMAAFLTAVMDGTLPEDVILINRVAMNAYFKSDPEGMEAWPGVVVEDDILISGR